MSEAAAQAILDPERQRQARVYARLQRRLEVIDMLFGGIYAFAWLVFGWAKALSASLSGLTGSPWLLVPLFALVFGAI